MVPSRWSVVVSLWSVVGGRCHCGRWSVSGGFVLRLYFGTTCSICKLSGKPGNNDTVENEFELPFF